jgi:holo-[acyl-carrier protein] synthase
MIKGVGNDILEIKRVSEACEKYGQKFLDRLFTKREQEYCKQHKEFSRHFAGRFAAKEAIVKALGTGFGSEISWLDLEIINDSRGKPEVFLSEKLKQNFGNPQLHLSISHGKEYATAVCVWEISEYSS